MTLRFAFTRPVPELTVTADGQHMVVKPAEGNMGQTVVHLPNDPRSAVSGNLTKAHFKTPSEHTVMLQHSPLEIQWEHEVNLNKT